MVYEDHLIAADPNIRQLLNTAPEEAYPEAVVTYIPTLEEARRIYFRRIARRQKHGVTLLRVGFANHFLDDCPFGQLVILDGERRSASEQQEREGRSDEDREEPESLCDLSCSHFAR
jgi:hypothetical protein